jgi:hypothetical protein
VTGIRGIRLQLLTELKDLIVNSPRGWIAVIAPNLIQEFFAAQYPLCVVGEELEQFKLVGR